MSDSDERCCSRRAGHRPAGDGAAIARLPKTERFTDQQIAATDNEQEIQKTKTGQASREPQVQSQPSERQEQSQGEERRTQDGPEGVQRAPQGGGRELQHMDAHPGRRGARDYGHGARHARRARQQYRVLLSNPTGTSPTGASTTTSRSILRTQTCAS